MPTHHLAQVNIARAKGEMTDPIMQGFVSRLDEINALAEASPGFVWRLTGEGNDATSLRPYPEDSLILVNLSVWDSPESLRNYVYKTVHVEVMRGRKAWFDRMQEMYYTMWWVPAGHIPTVAEAKARLDHLRAHGESAHAFTFAKVFPAPDAAAMKPIEGFADPCPAL